MKKVSIGLLGLGVVGSGVVKLIEDRQEELVNQLGFGVNVKRILVRDIEKERDVQTQTDLTTEPNDVLHDPEIDVVVEVMGGIEEARQHILEAFATKKNVVTANKDLIALHGPELQEAANRNQCDLFYEASVAGGTPILRGMSDGLVSDRIQQVMGIVNGTTNYILTKMDEEGVSYESALKDAQELGFAEADPTADVEGLDAARKMVILARLAFSANIELEDVEVSGITNIALNDLEYAKKLDYTMKLVGLAKYHDQHIEVSVQPTFISRKHPLAGVKNEYNAVFVNGEAVGSTMFYGPGAGSLPTATAVMSDVIAVIKNMVLGTNGRGFVKPCIDRQLTPPDQRYSQYYIRLNVKDEVGAFAAISELFNQVDISFERILQIPSSKYEQAEVILITHKTTLKKFEETLLNLENLNVVESVENSYRVEGDDSE